MYSWLNLDFEFKGDELFLSRFKIISNKKLPGCYRKLFDLRDRICITNKHSLHTRSAAMKKRRNRG